MIFWWHRVYKTITQQWITLQNKSTTEKKKTIEINKVIEKLKKKKKPSKAHREEKSFTTLDGIKPKR